MTLLVWSAYSRQGLHVAGERQNPAVTSIGHMNQNRAQEKRKQYIIYARGSRPTPPPDMGICPGVGRKKACRITPSASSQYTVCPRPQPSRRQSHAFFAASHITWRSKVSGGGSAESPPLRHLVGGVQRSAAAPSAALSNLRRAS